MTHLQIITFLVILLPMFWLIDGLFLRFACSCCLDERPTYGKSLLISLASAVINTVIVFELEQANGQLHFLIPWIVYLGSVVVVVAILLRVNPASALKVAATQFGTWLGFAAVLCGIALTLSYALKSEERTTPIVSQQELSAMQGPFVQQQAAPITMPPAQPWVAAEIMPGYNHQR